MAQVINTNILSLNAQRNLNNSQDALSTSLERLSSGLRINSAQDDAAGLAISERFTTQIRGLNQASRNANDGISLAQTAEAALGEVSQNLQRIRELAVQSVNATNSDSDRATLNQEVQQRLSEIDRISSQTSFNGRNVLDGTFGTAQFQVGANVGETIGLDLNTSTRTADVGAVATATSVDLSGVISEAQDAVPNSTAELGFATLTTGGTALADTVSVTVGTTELAAVAGDGSSTATITAADIDTALDGAAGTTLAGEGITFSGTAVGGDLVFTAADGSAFDIVVASGGTAATGGGTSILDTVGSTTVDNGSEAAAAQSLTLAADELTIQFGDNDALSVAADTYTTQQALADAVNEALGSNGTASLDSDTNVLSITSGEAITIGGTQATTVFSGTDFATAGSLTTANVSTVDASNSAIFAVDAALTSVSDLRSTFGAIQNRFESTIANLGSATENLSAARSRILDTDFAAETAALTRGQILQQAGISVLAQANAQPQSVLALLN